MKTTNRTKTPARPRTYDPAAELDEEGLDRLMSRVFGLGSQIIATALDAETLRFPGPAAVFHVEQGGLEKTA